MALGVDRWGHRDGKKLTTDPDFTEVALLVKYGVGIERAEAMDRPERLAWLVVIGQSEGGRFNWESMNWEKPDA